LNINPEIKFDGKSLVPIMKGDNKGFEDRIMIVSTQFSTDPEPWKRTALMHKNWRVVEGTELYNLETDPEQRTNVAEKYPEKMEKYMAAYDKWWAEISPTFDENPFFIVGDEAENPTTLFCHDWHSNPDFTPWAQRHIRSGYVNNGLWRVRIAEAGSYTLKLRRWPQETGLALHAEAPIRPALGGTSVTASKKGKALSIRQARIKFQNKDLSAKVDGNAEYVEFTVELEKGETQLQTWFTLDDGVELGA
jgi:hypothetical protein